MLCKHRRETAITTKGQRGRHGEGVLEDKGQCQVGYRGRNVLERVVLFRNFSASSNSNSFTQAMANVTVFFPKANSM